LISPGIVKLESEYKQLLDREGRGMSMSWCGLNGDLSGTGRRLRERGRMLIL
jgi:hypothetical protein